MNFVCEYTLIKELQAGNTSAYEFVYTNYYPSIAYFVKKNQGSDGDAQDIFQETIIILHQKLLNADFQLSSSLKTYLYSIARNSWLKRLRDNRLITRDEEQLILLQDQTQEDVPEQNLASPLEEQVHVWLANITSHCQHVLKSIYFDAQPINSLMNDMGWKNKHTANNQKYKCIQQIKKASQDKSSK